MSSKIKITFLGTNGWFTSDTGETLSVLIDTPKFAIVCDAGNGLRRLDEYCDLNKPVYLFLSHFHIDHISGLHLIAKFKFKKGLTVVTFKGGKKILNIFMNQPFTMPIRQLGFPVKVVEIEEGSYYRFPFGLEARQLMHSSKCFGYRFEIDGKIISYCTDTGPCPNLLLLAKNADLLITECALKPGQVSKSWPHLNPELAAQAARQAKAKKLILMHFDAYVYPSARDRAQAQKAAQKIFPHTTAVRDRMKVVV